MKMERQKKKKKNSLAPQCFPNKVLTEFVKEHSITVAKHCGNPTTIRAHYSMITHTHTQTSL